DQAAVLYYWGVPFCPRGLDPDEYTQVILTQMDVYQRSLKAAQRGLLRKAEWGDPVLPAPTEEPPCKKRRRLRRNESRGTQELGGVPAAGRGEDDPQDGEGGMNDAEKEEQEDGFFFKSVNCKIKKKKSKTNHSKWKLNLCCNISATPKIKSRMRRGLREGSPPEAAQPREEEPELDVCPESILETQLCDEGTQQLSSERPASVQPQPVVVVVEEEEEEEGSAAAVEGVTEKDTPAKHVQCPICMQSFPLLRIEVHAAYCDGPREEELLEEAASQGCARRRSSRKAQVIDENEPTSSAFCKSTSREKCYICRGYVPVGDFERHTESCIRRRADEVQGREDFLTALEQSEQKNIGKPADCKNEPVSLLDHEDDAAGEDQVPSDSPVRAFTPISEAKDCLVDFKQQFASRTGQRAGKRRRLKR
uniref:BRCA1-A complex subunit RAP80 n=1 Tax=Lepisosteus oculatus TaxID=7918 RepID=W5N3D4_LEPOC